MGARVKNVLSTVLVIGLADCASCQGHAVHPEAVKHYYACIEYLRDGQCVQAEERCRLALEYGENYQDPHNGLGLVALQCFNELDRAKGHFKDALSVNPDFAEAHNNLGTCFFRETPPNYDAACDEYKASIEIDPGYIDGRFNYASCLMRRGTIAGDKGDTAFRKKLFTEARSHLIRLLELRPGHYDGWHLKGLLDLIEERYDPAAVSFRRCLEIDPENPVCCYNLGNSYLHRGQCTEAIPQYICALRHEGNESVQVGARTNLALAYRACAEQDGALRVFLARIQEDPGNPTHHYDLGNHYYRKGLYDRAVNEWSNTARLEPRYCPAYYRLAEYAHKNLDTAAVLDQCRQFIRCSAEPDAIQATQAKAQGARCRHLVRELEAR